MISAPNAGSSIRTQNATTREKPITMAEMATPEPTETIPSALAEAMPENQVPTDEKASFIQLEMRSS